MSRCGASCAMTARVTDACMPCMLFTVGAGANKAGSTTTGLNAAKLDQETEDFRREWLGTPQHQG